MMYRTYSKRATALLLVCLLLLAAGVATRAGAQPGSDASTWSTPVNLSQSGAAVSPALVVDPAGTYHLFWQDPLQGYVYAAGDGATWDAGQPVDVPFSEPAFSTPGSFGFVRLHEPRLVADGDGRLHAFWINFNGGLSYSRVVADDAAGGQAAWTAPQELGQAALAPSAAVGEDGRLHLAYIRPLSSADFPAGVYYRRSDDGGATWDSAENVYRSAYLRVVKPEAARLETAVSGADVFLAWDDPLLDTVYFASSSGGGWSVQSIDSRGADDEAGVAGPAGVNLYAAKGILHLTWRAGTEQGCARYHQWSVNGGALWQPVEQLLLSTAGCPERSWAFAGDGGLVYLLTDVQGAANLQAWNGEAWSEAQVQPTLSQVTDPATFRGVSLGCWLPARSAANELRVIGCGSGAAEDIWLQQRALGDESAWFGLSDANSWADPELLTATGDRLSAPVIVADANGRYHAFWIGDQQNVPQPQTTIYYAYYTAGRWSRVAPLFTEAADQLAVTFSQGRLLLVWRNPDNGGLSFSQVPVDRAAFPLDWSPAVQVAPTQSLQSMPDMAIDADGIIYISYSVPLNEARGVYLVKSTDSGVTWGAPIQVFDAVAAGWEAVDHARLELTADQLHLIWTRYDLPENVPHSILFASSADSGQSWTQPALVIEDEIVWSDLLAMRNGVLLRVWRQMQTDGNRLWYQTSAGGTQWVRASLIPDVNDLSGQTLLALDPAGRPVLFQVIGGASGAATLLSWTWENNGWLSNPELALPAEVSADTPLAAAFAADGQVILLAFGSRQNAVTLTAEDLVFFASRAFVLPEVPLLLTPAPTFTPAAVESTPTPEGTQIAPAIVPTTVPIVSQATPVQSPRLGPIDLGTTSGALTLGILTAGLLVVGVFLVGARIIRIKRR